MGKVVRFLIDYAAILIAGVSTFVATESFVLAVFAGVFIAAYGFWCFKDGAGV